MFKPITDEDLEYIKGDDVSFARMITGKIDYNDHSDVLYMTVTESSRFGCKGNVVFCDAVFNEFKFHCDYYPRGHIWGVRELESEVDYELDYSRDRYASLTTMAVELHEKHRLQFGE